jgi:hypothetical protein
MNLHGKDSKACRDSRCSQPHRLGSDPGQILSRSPHVCRRCSARRHTGSPAPWSSAWRKKQSRRTHASQAARRSGADGTAEPHGRGADQRESKVEASGRHVDRAWNEGGQRHRGSNSAHNSASRAEGLDSADQAAKENRSIPDAEARSDPEEAKDDIGPHHLPTN